MELNLESTVIDISTILPSAFICVELGHEWEYPYDPDSKTDVVKYRICLYCGEREIGEWERKGLTPEKMRSFVQDTLKSLPPMKFETNFNFTDVFRSKKTTVLKGNVK